MTLWREGFRGGQKYRDTRTAVTANAAIKASGHNQRLLFWPTPAEE